MTQTPAQTTLCIGSDHGGFTQKQALVELLRQEGYQVVDCGPASLDSQDDYPPIAFQVGEETVARLNRHEKAFGILLCRSGAGMSIAANKVRGVRAAVISSVAQAEHARQHNDANVATLAADWIGEDEIGPIVHAFITTNFSDEERHIRRINQITTYEQK